MSVDSVSVYGVFSIYLNIGQPLPCNNRFSSAFIFIHRANSHLPSAQQPLLPSPAPAREVAMPSAAGAGHVPPGPQLPTSFPAIPLETFLSRYERQRRLEGVTREEGLEEDFRSIR